MKELATELQKDGSHQNPRDTKYIVRYPRLIRRFPRRTAEDVAFYRRAKLISEIENEAVEWIGRGREANIELGRRFIRLKDLIGHGHFEEYYERKFGQPYGIKFRTAQVYMQLARKADEDKYADPALFPPATDPKAVAIKEATETQRRDVANAKPESTDEASATAEPKDQKPRTSLCTCRLQIRVTEKQRAQISALWRSEHRALAESQVIDLLTNLCSQHEISASSEEE